MKTKTQKLALLLAVLLLGSTATACGSSETTETTEETTAVIEETGEVDPFAGTDFGGKELRISSSIDAFDATNAHRLIAGSGELNGEIVNDAVFNRNQMVEELLNVKLAFSTTEWDYNETDTGIEQLVMSGDCGFEVIINDMNALVNSSMKGYMHTVGKNKILDFSQNYWYGEAMEALEIVDDAVFVMLGDVFTDSLASAHTLYYNKEVIFNHYADERYVMDMILEGKWTLDQMIEIMETVAVDTDGNGKMQEGDMMGYTILGKYGSVFPIIEGLAINWVEKTGDGIQFGFNNERSVKALEKMNALVWHETTMTDPKDGSTVGLLNIFANGTTAFVGYLRLSDLENMRDITFGVGLAPYPKLDEEQESYQITLHTTSEVGAIVSTMPVTEMDFVATCLEVMAREANKTIIPAYYEESLKLKYVGGSDDAAMIDIIRSSIVSPFISAYNAPLGSLRNYFIDPIGKNSNDFASTYQARIKASEAGLVNLIASYEDIMSRVQ